MPCQPLIKEGGGGQGGVSTSRFPTFYTSSSFTPLSVVVSAFLSFSFAKYYELLQFLPIHATLGVPLPSPTLIKFLSSMNGSILKPRHVLVTSHMKRICSLQYLNNTQYSSRGICLLHLDFQQNTNSTKPC